MNSEQKLNPGGQPSDDLQIDFRQIILKYVSYWPWFLISILIFSTLGYLYGRYATPIYKISARVLINDPQQKGGASAGGDMLDLGSLIGAKSTVDNEVEILKTRVLMEQVVKDLRLNISYFKEGRINDVEIYEAPFIVRPIDNIDTLNTVRVEVDVLESGKILLSGNGLDTTVNFNSIVNIPSIGALQFVKNPSLPSKPGKYSFTVGSVDSKVSNIMGNLTVSISNKQISIIDLTYDNSVPRKGVDILNQLIYNYIKANLQDKNEVADSTIAFIKRRLLIIGSELGSAEGNIQGFKQRNGLADMTQQGQLLVTTNQRYADDIAKTETQITIIKSLLEYLADTRRNKSVLPSTLMPSDVVFSSAIEKYNTLVLERGRKLVGLTESNPIVLNLDNEIAAARSGIISNLNSTLEGLTITKNKLKKQEQTAEGEIRQVPATERNYLELARQQQIKQELYLFLMQKSEETAISKTANIANSRVIDPPRSETIPHQPKRSIILIIFLAVGFLVPFIILYIQDLLNTKVENKDDIVKRTDVPVVGEISHNDTLNNLAVEASSRSAISEQFRALRTNLSFFLKEKNQKIILVTSSMSGEGKSFVAINLGHILALSGKRVLLMEMDLRKPGLSAKLNISNTTGFTNYIISNDNNYSSYIKPLEIHQNLSIMGSGPIPPNPAEMIMDPRTGALLTQLKNDYDFIIIDVPPVGIVTDAQLLAPFADVSLYLVRQRYTDKNQINIIQNLYQTKKMNNMGIVVNDIKASKSYGYGYGQGYGYSYGYGYGYGYGNYNNDRQPTLFQRLFNRK